MAVNLIIEVNARLLSKHSRQIFLSELAPHDIPRKGIGKLPDLLAALLLLFGLLLHCPHSSVVGPPEQPLELLGLVNRGPEGTSVHADHKLVAMIGHVLYISHCENLRVVCRLDSGEVGTEQLGVVHTQEEVLAADLGSTEQVKEGGALHLIQVTGSQTGSPDSSQGQRHQVVGVHIGDAEPLHPARGTASQFNPGSHRACRGQ